MRLAVIRILLLGLLFCWGATDAQKLHVKRDLLAKQYKATKDLHNPSDVEHTNEVVEGRIKEIVEVAENMIKDIAPSKHRLDGGHAVQKDEDEVIEESLETLNDLVDLLITDTPPADSTLARRTSLVHPKLQHGSNLKALKMRIGAAKGFDDVLNAAMSSNPISRRLQQQQPTYPIPPGSYPIPAYPIPGVYPIPGPGAIPAAPEDPCDDAENDAEADGEYWW